MFASIRNKLIVLAVALFALPAVGNFPTGGGGGITILPNAQAVAGQPIVTASVSPYAETGLTFHLPTEGISTVLFMLPSMHTPAGMVVVQGSTLHVHGGDLEMLWDGGVRDVMLKIITVNGKIYTCNVHLASKTDAQISVY